MAVGLGNVHADQDGHCLDGNTIIAGYELSMWGKENALHESRASDISRDGSVN